MASVNGVVRGSSLVAMLLGGVAGSLLGPRRTFVVAGVADGGSSQSSSTAGSPRRLPLRAGKPPPLLPRLRTQTAVLLHRQVEQLALKLPPADVALLVERPGSERGADAAVGLGLVRAVVEAAERRRRGDVVERASRGPRRSPRAGSPACRACPGRGRRPAGGGAGGSRSCAGPCRPPGARRSPSAPHRRGG